MKLHFDLLAFGQSGIGKTTLVGRACRVPEMCPVLLISIEQQLWCLRFDNPHEIIVDWKQEDFSLPTTDDNLQFVRINSWPKLFLLIKALKRDSSPFQTVIIDSLTEAMAYAIEYAVMDSIGAGRKTAVPQAKYGSATPGLSEYGRARKWLLELLRAFTFLPVNSLATALYQWDRPDEQFTRAKRILPAMDTKARSEVGAKFNLVLYYATVKDKEGKDVRILRSQPGDWQAKSDWNLPDEGIIDPTMQKLYTLLMKGGES